MAKKRAEPRRMSTPTPFEQARDELFSHILRCGVLEASAEHQKEWFDDTMQYLADRYDGLDEPQLTELRVLGERYCRPVVARSAIVAASVRGRAALPPGRKPAEAPAKGQPHTAAQTELRIPPPAAPRCRLHAHQRREVA